MNLGENIYRLRTEKNMSQGDLADALDVSRQSVSKWENNSATPELEKLLKMSELFGVTLDELVGMKRVSQPNQSGTAEPTIIYIEKPVAPRISKHTLIGVVLLLSSLLYALLLSSSVFNLTWAFIMAVPVAACGILFLFVKYPLFYCGWVGAATYWSYFLILFHMNWEQQYAIMLLGVALVIVMIFYSVFVHRKGLIHIPVWVWVIGSIILVCAFILLWINVVPPIGVSSTKYASTQSIEESMAAIPMDGE